MSRTSLVFLCLVVSACATTNAPHDSWIDEAKAVIQSHESFARTGDLAGIMTNVAEDVVVLAPETPLIKGKSAFRELYAGFLKGGTSTSGMTTKALKSSAIPSYFTGSPEGGSSQRRASQPHSLTTSSWYSSQPTGRFQFWRIAFGPSGRSA